jgi:hypothetical protein
MVRSALSEHSRFFTVPRSVTCAQGLPWALFLWSAFLSAVSQQGYALYRVADMLLL